MASERLRIVFGDAGTLAEYADGGGHWSVVLQYLLGLRALGHEVLLLEILGLSEDRAVDASRVERFFQRLAPYGLEAEAVVLAHPPDLDRPDLSDCETFGAERTSVEKAIKAADLLFNFSGRIRDPFLSYFRRRAFLDVDPGFLHVCIETPDADFYDHDVFLTVGSKVGDADCRVPTLGVEWHPFEPFVYLPMWEPAPDPGRHAPFSSITHWSPNELWTEWEGELLDSSKRHAYLRYVALPAVTGRPFELATNLTPADDVLGDAEVLGNAGWTVADAWAVAASPADYGVYIAASRAEIMCPKPVYRQLRTGWFSDRSVCYLATGRPVLAEDTGYSERLPSGEGIVAFHDMASAIEGVVAIDADYAEHSRTARELAEEYFDSRHCLQQILDVCA